MFLLTPIEMLDFKVNIVLHTILMFLENVCDITTFIDIAHLAIVCLRFCYIRSHDWVGGAIADLVNGQFVWGQSAGLWIRRLRVRILSQSSHSSKVHTVQILVDVKIS